MSDLIHDHYDYDDIQKLFIDKDVKFWKEELAIIADEVSLAKNIFIDYIRQSQYSYDNILSKINEYAELNQSFQENLIQYLGRLESLKECDDMQCETYFVNDHKEFKDKIDHYFSAYRQFKRKVILKIRK